MSLVHDVCVCVLYSGANTGSYYGIGTLLNPIVLAYFPGATTDAGRIGLTLVLAGVGGSIIAGLWLDKTKLFKLVHARSLHEHVMRLAAKTVGRDEFIDLLMNIEPSFSVINLRVLSGLSVRCSPTSRERLDCDSSSAPAIYGCVIECCVLD